MGLFACWTNFTTINIPPTSRISSSFDYSPGASVYLAISPKLLSSSSSINRPLVLPSSSRKFSKIPKPKFSTYSKSSPSTVPLVCPQPYKKRWLESSLSLVDELDEVEVVKVASKDEVAINFFDQSSGGSKAKELLSPSGSVSDLAELAGLLILTLVNWRAFS